VANTYKVIKSHNRWQPYRVDSHKSEGEGVSQYHNKQVHKHYYYYYYYHYYYYHYYHHYYYYYHHHQAARSNKNKME